VNWGNPKNKNKGDDEMKRNNRLMVFICLILVTALSLVACTGPANNPTEPGKSVAETSGESAVTAVESAPEYNFVLVQAGIHPFYDPFPQAIDDATADLGIPKPQLQAVAFLSQEEQFTLIESLIAQGINGLAFQPADPVAGNEIITQMMNQGINVVGFAGPPSEPTDMLFCLATDTETAAYEGAKHLIEAIGGSGNIVHITGQAQDGNTQKRIEGVQRAVDENPGMTLIQTITDVDATEAAQNAIDSLLSASEDQIDGIISTVYIPSVTLATVFTQRQESRIKVVACDADDAVIQAIKDGYITGTMNQNPYAQAYLCIKALKMFEDGWTYKEDSPFFLDSGFVYLNQDNVGQKDELARKSMESLASSFEDYFNPPA